MSKDSSVSLETPNERSSQEEEDHNNEKKNEEEEEEREEEEEEEEENGSKQQGRKKKYNKLTKKKNNYNHITSNYIERKERLRRACTTRSYSSSAAQTTITTVDRSKQNSVKKEKIIVEEKEEEVDEVEEEKIQQSLQCSKIITPLVDSSPQPSLLPRWNLRSMWELASVLNFLNVFGPLLNIKVEFSAEELETALLTPNNTLDDIHIPLLKAIPPVTRMALGRATWVTVLCRKLRDWWHWVADGEIPIVASHGAETDHYKELDPGTRVLILKALCDIRVEQEDIRNYIDGNIKRGMPVSVYRKERIGGDSRGISYWYEDDPVIGHRLYREIRKVEVNKVKAKGIPSLPTVTCQWETVATNFDEFQDVSEKLFTSKNRTEASLGKKLKIDMLPEIEKIHKKKEKLIKKQHREAILLDNSLTADGLATGGRSLRDRKPVTYTFDDYDRSINEAIKVTKRRASSPELVVRKDFSEKPEPSANGRWNGPSSAPQHLSYDLPSPRSTDNEETDADHRGHLDRSNRRRQRPQRYSVKEFVEAVSDNDADFDSDDDIVGEAVYDEEYLRSRKLRKISSSSEGDEEYHWDEENAEDEEEEEEEEASLSSSEDTDEPQRYKKLLNNSRRGAKLRSVGEIQSGLRRSKRATHSRINYRQYEFSESEADSTKPEISYSSEKCSDASHNVEYSTGSQDSHVNLNEKEMDVDLPVQDCNDTGNQEQKQSPEKTDKPDQGAEVVGRRHFLDLNELAPGTGFDDGPD